MQSISQANNNGIRHLFTSRRSVSSFLLQRDFVTQAEGDPLSLAPYPDISIEFPIILFLNTNVYQSILPKHTLRIQVNSQESTFTF